jgi:flavin reductase (DIM6/NTAB) family NADH-FMN oxidoreductase RutF/rubredoxin
MLTDNPTRIVVFVNKANYSEELLRKTGVFNVSILSESAPFDIFKQFGFQSGRDVDKFAGGMYATSENGLYYLPEHANAVLSAKVVDSHDYGTHTLFVAEVTEAKKLNNEKSVTYEYYQSNIKPKPQAAKVEEPSAKGKWVCKICGYVHEGEELPDDFICPWCKHPASDFEKVN